MWSGLQRQYIKVYSFLICVGCARIWSRSAARGGVPQVWGMDCKSGSWKGPTFTETRALPKHGASWWLLLRNGDEIDEYDISGGDERRERHHWWLGFMVELQGLIWSSGGMRDWMAEILNPWLQRTWLRFFFFFLRLWGCRWGWRQEGENFQCDRHTRWYTTCLYINDGLCVLKS